MLSRRRLLTGGAAVAGLGAAAVAGVVGLEHAPDSLKARLGLAPEAYVPDAPEGRLRLETVRSRAMGGEVDLFTAVPAGHGDGAGLPVVVVLHGANATAADFRGYGLGRFLTRAVERGAAPFVLAGTDDGPAGWVPSGRVDPQAMLTDELPGWLEQRGFDAGRRALWGWSRGGYGALRLAEAEPTWARAAALFSPAVVVGDPAGEDLAALGDLPLGVWCGTSDPFYDAVRALVERCPRPPEVLRYAEGAHTRAFWHDHTLEAFSWLAGRLFGPGEAQG